MQFRTRLAFAAGDDSEIFGQCIAAAVFRAAIETDTCDNPVSVEVWLDPDGY